MTVPAEPDAIVDIALATFNGAQYLPEQLASIELQVGPSWRLLIADDGSTDDTLAAVERFRRRHPPERVVVLPPAPGRLGPSKAFGRLLAETSAPYVALCDQDDVWHPRKLQLALHLLLKLEKRTGGAPCLVHTDLEVVDGEERTVSPSLNRYQNLGAQHRTDLRRLLVQNAVTGCTAVMNRSLVEMGVPIPAEAIMHDWWLALVAASLGAVEYLDRALVRYRQHETNALGARRYTFAGDGRTLADMRLALYRTYAQAQALVDRLGPALPEPERRVATEFSELRNLGPLARRTRVLARGYFKAGLARNVGMLCAM